MELRKSITLPSGFCLDFTNMLGPEQVTDKELDQLQNKITAAAQGLRLIRETGQAVHHLSKDGTPEPVYFTRLPYLLKRLPQYPGAAPGADGLWPEGTQQVRCGGLLRGRGLLPGGQGALRLLHQ